MDSYALLLAATLNAGTVLAIASLGLLINEKVGEIKAQIIERDQRKSGHRKPRCRRHDAVRSHCRVCHGGPHG